MKWSWRNLPEATALGELVGVLNRKLKALEDALNAPERFVTIRASDTTPSVLGVKHLVTANALATVIAGFDDGYEGKEITVKVGDANTTIDFTGTTLKGNGGVDWVPGSGDFMRCTFDGTNWLCQVTEI